MTMTEDRAQLETWKSSIAGTVCLMRFDHRGELNKAELVEGGRTFHISVEERRINSERAASEDLDVFKNGMLTPVRLIEGSTEAREIASNPNIISESEMVDLVKAHPKTFEKRLSEIRNPVTLERLLATAVDEDATIKRVEAIKARLSEVAPSLFTEVSYGSGGGRGPSAPAGIRPVTPK